MKQKTSKIILALALIGLSATFSAYGETSYTITGTGSNLTLTITGTGDMPNYTFGDTPWYSQRTNIKTLIIENGITAIGEWAFANCAGFTGTLTIPSSVTSISHHAFPDFVTGTPYAIFQEFQSKS